jgi:hypothetical protein
MTNDVFQSSRDWLQNPRTKLLAWWLPQAVIVAGLFVPVAARATIWIVALTWMGTACILNAKRCGRTHCRYTGPCYLTMIAPTFGLGFGFPSVDMLSWLILAFLILLEARSCGGGPSEHGVSFRRCSWMAHVSLSDRSVKSLPEPSRLVLGNIRAVQK